jgi:hypothetical protein
MQGLAAAAVATQTGFSRRSGVGKQGATWEVLVGLVGLLVAVVVSGGLQEMRSMGLRVQQVIGSHGAATPEAAGTVRLAVAMAGSDASYCACYPAMLWLGRMHLVVIFCSSDSP